jgi:type VI secretion system protein VasJ
MPVEDVISDVKSRLEALLAPISGGVGVDVSYDEAFEMMKNEVDKLQALSGGKVDWGAVAVAADELLSEKSKDFRVALYWAAAKVHTDGFQGLLDGFVLIQELIATFWEPMYPPLKRPKARGNLVGWFADMAGPLFQGFQPTAADADRVKALDRVTGNVDGELRDKLGEHYPGMMNIRNLCRSLLASLPKDAPPPAAAPPPASAPQQQAAAYQPPPLPPPQQSSSGGGGPTAESITTVDEAMNAVSSCAAILARIGDTLRAADPGNPLAYRYARDGYWLEITQVPPSENGVTLVPSPPDGVRANLEQLMSAENYLAVIHAADEASATFILWLDLHRYVANAMDRLGAVFLNAKKALVRSLGAHLARFPQLVSMSFSDGTPFADAQTKMWLEAEVQSGGGGGGGGGGGTGAASVLDAPIAEARTLAASGKLSEAIDVVAKASAAAPSGADRFRGRLAVAKLCLQSGQFAVARAQLEGLVGLVEQHRLSDWEPELCADLYGALYASHRGLNKGDEVLPEARAREAAAFERLCQFDPGAALKLSAE